MLAFIGNHFSSICILITALASLTLGVINMVLNSKAKRTGQPISAETSAKLAGASETLTKVYKMLPSLITFSETMNSGKAGAVKKEFVIDYVNQLFAMMGTSLDEDALTNISKAIDDIVTATKQMHTGGTA